MTRNEMKAEVVRWVYGYVDDIQYNFNDDLPMAYGDNNEEVRITEDVWVATLDEIMDALTELRLRIEAADKIDFIHNKD